MVPRHHIYLPVVLCNHQRIQELTRLPASATMCVTTTANERS